MLGRHVYDPAFSNSSGELKRALSKLHDLPFDACLDLPCGNGRNIFLLASYFKKIIGVDINEKYLAEIEAMIPQYRQQFKGVIETRKADLATAIPDDIDRFDFITTIHFYNYSLLRQVIELMRPGALFFIETQGCAGSNYKGLPTEEEVKYLFRDTELLIYKSHPCSSAASQSKSIAFKALVRKAYERK